MICRHTSLPPCRVSKVTFPYSSQEGLKKVQTIRENVNTNGKIQSVTKCCEQKCKHKLCFPITLHRNTGIAVGLDCSLNSNSSTPRNLNISCQDSEQKTYSRHLQLLQHRSRNKVNYQLPEQEKGTECKEMKKIKETNQATSNKGSLQPLPMHYLCITALTIAFLTLTS